MNNIQTTALSSANLLLREKKYSDALHLYNIILRAYSSEVPPSLVKSIEFNKSLCLRRLSCKNILSPHYVPAASSQVNSPRRNPIILLINSSHSHASEVKFWSEFSEVSIQNGMNVIDIAFRKTTSFPATHLITHPARLSHLSKKLHHYFDLPLPAWADQNLIELYVDWEHRRWQIEKYDPEVRLGCLSLINYIEHIVTHFNPAVLFTTNKIDPPNNFAYLAAKSHGIEYRFIERSPLNSQLIETSGMFSESSCVEGILETLLINKQEPAYDQPSQDLRSIILQNPYGFREAEANTTNFDNYKNILRPLFFLPLDNCLWTGWAQENHPQGDIDYPVFRTPDIAISEINDIVKSIGGTLVVKPHPSCKEWLRFSHNIPDVIFTEADLNFLCKEADVVITFLTKVSYLALASGKPVVSFRGGLLDHLGVTYQVSSKSEVKENLINAHLKKSFSKKLDRFNQLLPLLNTQFYNNGKMAADFIISSLKNSYSIDQNAEVNSLLNFQAPKKVVAERFLATNVSTFDKRADCTVLIDISRLTCSRLRKSGISRYMEALVRGISADIRINPIFAYNSQINEYGLSGHYFNQLQQQLNIKLVPMAEALAFVDSTGEPYIYHSPINPLPSKDGHRYMLRVITIHDIFHVSLPSFYSQGNYITKSVIESIDSMKDGIIFDSSYSRTDYEQYIGCTVPNSTVVHLAVGEPFSSLVSEDLDSTFDLTGEILCLPCQGDPRKGFKRMMHIASTWADYSPSRQVLVFGNKTNQPLFNDSLKYVVQNNINKFIYITNPTDEQLVSLYRKSVAQLYLSEAEGFGLPPLEAMACGCPSILLSNTSLGEVYHGWDYLLQNNATDEQVLVAIEKVNSMNNSVRIKAQEFSKRYTWEMAVKNTVNFFLKQFNSNS